MYFSMNYCKITVRKSFWPLSEDCGHPDLIRVLKIFFPLSVIWTDYHLKFVSQERSLSVQKKMYFNININLKVLWIHVVGDSLHNSLLLTGQLIFFLTWPSAIYKFYQPHVYTDHSMPFTCIVKAFLRLLKVLTDYDYR